jgi:hypothetical protein
MEDNQVLITAHPQGEVKKGDRDRDLVDRGQAVETFGGKVFVRWDADAAVTAFAPVTYFLEFLKANGLAACGESLRATKLGCKTTKYFA